MVEGCVFKPATHVTFDHVFWPAEYFKFISQLHVDVIDSEPAEPLGGVEGVASAELPVALLL